MLNPSGEEIRSSSASCPQVSTWRAPTLLLHGGKDLLVSVQQANLLRESLEVANKPYRFVLYPNNGHRLPVEDVRKKAPPFSKKPPDLRAMLPLTRVIDSSPFLRASVDRRKQKMPMIGQQTICC
jgi:acetyl esterase/lipase